MATVEEKIYNVDLIIEDLKTQPQTYATILAEQVYNATWQFSLRRKLNKLCNANRIFKGIIPGTRFGQVIFYIEPRKYKILVEASRVGVNIYYFFEYEKTSKFYIKVKKYWHLHNNQWQEKNEEKIFFEGNVLKFI